MYVHFQMRSVYSTVYPTRHTRHNSRTIYLRTYAYAQIQCGYTDSGHRVWCMRSHTQFVIVYFDIFLLNTVSLFFLSLVPPYCKAMAVPNIRSAYIVLSMELPVLFNIDCLCCLCYCAKFSVHNTNENFMFPRLYIFSVKYDFHIVFCCY